VGQKLICGLFVAATVVIGMSTVGHAQQRGQAPPTRAVPVAPETQFIRVRPPSSTQAVPEIDPASATAALAMLAGGVLVIRARRR